MIVSEPNVKEIAEALDISVRNRKEYRCALDAILAFIDGEGRWMYTMRQQVLGSATGLLANILSIFQSEKSDPKCCLKVLETLLKLCHYNSNDRYSGNVENIKKLGAAGACSMVVKILRHHVAEATASVSTYEWMLRGLLKKYKGIDDCISQEIIQYLYDEDTNIGIAQCACDFIRILGWCNSANTSILISSGACEVIVGAVRIHSKNCFVAVEGCEV